MKDHMDKIKALVTDRDKIPHGFLGAVIEIAHRFTSARASEAAASLAYYAIFSLFPLLLLLIGIASFFLEREEAFQQLIALTEQTLPEAGPLIENNLRRVIQLRGPISAAGAIGLAWSASSFFAALVYHINRAWPKAAPRNFLQQRLLALGIIALLLALIVLSLSSTVIVQLVPALDPLVADEEWAIDTLPGWKVIAFLVPYSLTFLAFLGLYRWLPRVRVPWRAGILAAGIVTVAWQITTAGFSWYLRSGIAQYELVYGSLGAVIAMMFWIYLSNTIILLGAHISAVVGERLQLTYRDQPEEDLPSES